MSGCIEKICRKGFVDEELIDLFNGFFIEGILVLDQTNETGVLDIVWHNLDQLWEVPRIQFPDALREEINVLIKLIKKGDSLNDHVVRLVNVELYLGP